MHRSAPELFNSNSLREFESPWCQNFYLFLLDEQVLLPVVSCSFVLTVLCQQNQGFKTLSGH